MSLLPNRTCLVLMPFDAEYLEVYTKVYKPVCEKNGFRCWRVDEVNKPGSITKDIINGIMDADLIIADLTKRNANVFYELGIAHWSGNKTLMTAQKFDDIPFDIGNYRVLIYDQSITGAEKLYASLDAGIKELDQLIEQTNNPVQEVLESRSIRANPGRKKLLLETVRVGMLKKAFRDIIETEKLVYIEDLRKLDLEELRLKYGIGPSVMSQIAGVMLQLDVVGDPHKIHQVALKYRFTPDARHALNW